MAEKEYIEREAVMKIIDDYGCTHGGTLGSHSGAVDVVGSAIYKLPAADVAPVKHGHFRRLTFSGDTIICSECKMAYNIFETNGAENFNFCPHCGAKIMDGGDDE